MVAAAGCGDRALGPGGDAGAPGDLAAADLRAPEDFAGADLFGPDLAGAANSIPCTNTPCSTTGNVCCVSLTTVQGTCQSAPCDPNSNSYSCDGPEDCPGTECCLDVSNTPRTICQADCGTEYRLCHRNQDCNPGQSCAQLEFGPPNFFACIAN